MSDQFKLQVGDGHYQRSSYNDLARFIAYYYQISTIRQLPIKSILEVGSGNGLVAYYLKSIGLAVKVCDFDARVKPDIIADVRSLPLADDSFDAVAAFQILEHIPFKEVVVALGEIKRVAKKYAVISVPHRVSYLEIIIKFPFIRTILKKDFLDLAITKGVKFNAAKTRQHYWEIDEHAFKMQDLRQKISADFTILREFSPILDKYHYFFVLEVKK